MIRTAIQRLAVAGVILLGAGSGALAQTPIEPPILEPRVAEGALPPVAERLPEAPLVTEPLEIGRHGGEITWIAGRARDIRIMNVYGYARLVGYTADLEVVPDILEAIEIEDERVFTLHLRPGMRWSDGHPFTTEDFHYEWFDVQLNEELRPFGPIYTLLVDGEPPEVEIIDAHTIRYSWPQPNPALIPALAGARPEYLYAPAHYMRQFHEDYADPEELERLVAESGARDWVGLHIGRGNLYEANNPDLPTLQPWQVRTAPPSQRFVFERNPYYHRVDPDGRQLPYLDRVIVNIADSSLIAAQTGSGASDLQARHLQLDDYTFLVQGADRHSYDVHLWETALGSEMALYPNFNAADPVWRELIRDVRFRRALSLAINREEINEVVYFGLARPSANTVLPASPFWREELAEAWTRFDLTTANALLDEMGLTEWSGGLRLAPDGRRLEIVVETAGERTSEVDILQLIADSWREIGIRLVINSSQREVFRNRVFSGDIVMSVWFGLDNGLLTEETLPTELAPVDQNWLQYPVWGQHWQTQGAAGAPPDMSWGERLLTLYRDWMRATEQEERNAFVEEMLQIHAEQVTSIGLVQGVPQPVVVNRRLRNVPADAVYSWDPGGHFGRYRPDTFWLAD